MTHSIKSSLGTVVLALTAAGVASAQPKPLADAAMWADSARVAIEAAQIAGDVNALHAARAVAERALVAYPNDALLLHYEGYALFREAGQLVGRNQLQAAAPLLARAAAALEASAKKRPLPETSALLSAVYGFQIGADPSLGMTLGMVTSQVMGEALGAGASNPRVWMLHGMSTLFTPEQYGGGTAPAIEQLTKAVALFAQDRPARPLPAWGQAESHAWLGVAYQKAGDAARAAAEFRQALAIEPGYAWVKNALLPGVSTARP